MWCCLVVSESLADAEPLLTTGSSPLGPLFLEAFSRQRPISELFSFTSLDRSRTDGTHAFIVAFTGSGPV